MTRLLLDTQYFPLDHERQPAPQFFIAQALHESLTLVTAGGLMLRYPIEAIRVP